MDQRTVLLFMAQEQGLKGRALAQHLNISPAYASFLISGARPIPAKVGGQIQSYADQSTAFAAFSNDVQRIELHLRRPLNGAEQTALAETWPDLQAVLALVGLAGLAGHGGELGQDPQRGQTGEDQFLISTALASLQSISQILDEEPDLPAPQRRQFIATVKEQAALLTQRFALDKVDKMPDDSPQVHPAAGYQRPDRFVDQVFAAQAYYFADLEAEADLAVRRARRHGPLGTFSLVSRLQDDLGIHVEWVESGGMQPSSLNQGLPDPDQKTIALDPSLGEAQLRFRLAQHLVALECDRLLTRLVANAAPPDATCGTQLKRAFIAYTAAAMFMPYDPFLAAAETHRYDLDWLGRHFACAYEQVCHRILALRKPGQAGVPFGLLRVSPAGQTITRVSLPGLALPDRFAACPLWAAYGALRQGGETLTQLAEFPDGQQFLFIGRLSQGPRAHFGGPRRLTSLMLACDWAYRDRVIYADGHDAQRPASVTPVGHACITCPRQGCRSRVRAFQGN